MFMSGAETRALGLTQRSPQFNQNCNTLLMANTEWNKRRLANKKRMGANVGVFAPIHFSWLLSSPQQPLETEDSPTVSLAPKYTSQGLCRARKFSATHAASVFA